MQNQPRISIITPSYNQGQFIADTIESVLAQKYPDFEHIIIDGGSTDNTLEVLSRYPHLKVISEPDRGQGDAINKGFRHATGSIWGFLNSDDTYKPGALHRVSQEIDPTNNIHVVMGRCAFTDAAGEEVGIEHPSAFENHRRILKIWRGYAVPQPAVFWTPEVWATCGEMDLSLHFALDYDLFCRFSQKYTFHIINQVLATYRLHDEAKTSQQSDSERLEDAIKISKRYWGNPFTPKYWSLALSLARYRLNRTARARRWIQKARNAWHAKRGLIAFIYGLGGCLLAPEVAFYLGVYPRLSRNGKRIFAKVMRLFRGRQMHPETIARMNYSELYPDNWAGPILRVVCEVRDTARTLIVRGVVLDSKPRNGRHIQISLDDQSITTLTINEEDHFLLTIPLESPLPSGKHRIEIRADWWFVPYMLSGVPDYRPLSWVVKEIQLR